MAQDPFDSDGDTGVATRTRAAKRLARPKLFRVLLHNDDYTTRDFVVMVLRSIFHRSEADAVQIMLHVHQRGVGTAGVYPFEIAETKVATVHELARQAEYPLRLSLEPEEG